jgi:NADH-quinone oxidoreductase subunit G
MAVAHIGKVALNKSSIKDIVMGDKKRDLSKKVTVYIDNVAYQVSNDNNLLAGVLSQKLNLPYFCWHPSMGSVGACRQCAVTQYQDENDTRGRLVMACMTPVSDGMRIGLQDNTAEKFREQVVSAMMTNHPHDCPVCAEGGECHLQDMTVMTGHSSRDYQGSKRTFNNQNLGELVGHEMNRCITCYRCTRFYNDYAGGKDFGVYGSRNQVYFGRQKNGTLESEFSGNLVEVCPTGVFTNKVFSAHYTRKWDLQSAPSVCAHCSVGCNTSVGERYGSVRRVMNRYNPDINGYFLCDRGRYGIGFVNGEQRIKKAKGINQQSPEQLSLLDVSKALSHFRGKRFVGIGSARASLEANVYLKKIVGEDNFSAGYSHQQMKVASVQQKLLQQAQSKGEILSLTDIEKCDFILIIGEDITKSSPRMALSIRQACRNAGIDKAAGMGVASWQDSAVRTISGKLNTPFFSIHTTATKLDELTEQHLLLTPDEIEQMVLVLTNAIFSLLNEDFDNEHEKQLAKLSRSEQLFISRLTTKLMAAETPLIVTGDSLVNANIFAAIEKLTHCLAQEKLTTKLNLVVISAASNSFGLLSLLDKTSLSTEQVLSQLRAKEVDGIICLEQELAAFSDDELTQIREGADTIIVLDHTHNRVSDFADIIFPVAAVSEGNGHYVNYQGRVQKYNQVHAPALPILDSWKWLALIEKSFESSTMPASILRKSKLDPINNLTQLHRYFEESFSMWPLSSKEVNKETKHNQPVARMTKRASGRTSQIANYSIHEAKVTQDKELLYSFSMEGDKPNTHNAMPFTWAPGWNSNESINHYQVDIDGPLINDHENHDYLSFVHSLIGLTPDDEAIVENQTESESALLVYFPQGSLFKGEWQSANTAEFKLLTHDPEKHLTIYLSIAVAERQGWGNGQWLKVITENETIIGRLKCNGNLPENLAYGDINELANKNAGVSITLAEAKQSDVLLQQENRQDLYQQAKNSQEKVLKQLKEFDQHIPIRFVAGGLDEA